MADVTPDVEAEVTTDGTGGTVERHGLAEHLAPSLDSVESLPNHAAYRPRAHVLNKTWEEFLLLEVDIVRFKAFPGRGLELKCGELEAAGLEALDDLADKATLDTVRLDHDIGALLVLGFCLGHLECTFGSGM